MKVILGITTKIIAISVSVLLLLLLIATSTHLKIRTINTEVKYLAEHILPVVKLIDEATINMLEQEVHIERLLKLAHSSGDNHQRIERQKQDLERYFQSANTGLLHAQTRLNKAIATMPAWLDGQLTTDTISAVERVRQENQTYHQKALSLILHLDDFSLDKLKTLELALSDSEHRLNRDAESVLGELQNFAINTAVQAEQHQEAILLQNLILTSLALLAGLVYAGFLSRKISRPVTELNNQVCHALENKQFSAVSASSHDEVGLLTSRFNLALQTLRRSERFKDMFGQYLDPRLVAQLESDLSDLNLDGERQKVTVILSNLDGFAPETDAISPEQLILLINQYLEIQLSVSDAWRGMLNFTLTEILSFWTHPFSEQQQQSDQACHMLLAQLEGVKQFKAYLQQHFSELTMVGCIELRAGLSSGELVVANMGPSGARAFTVIGDEVNAASRLKGVARFFSVNVVLSDNIVQTLSQQFVTRPLGWVKVPGKEDPIKTWQLLGYQKLMSQSMLTMLDAYQRAYLLFEQQQYQQASAAFLALQSQNPDDPVVAMFAQQCRLLAEQNNEADPGFYWEITHK